MTPSCAPSANYVSPAKPLPELPGFVTFEASKGPEALPVATPKGKEVQRLIERLHMAQLNKARALKAAVESYEAARAQLKGTQ